jgi:hypothetical protein
VVNRDLNQSVAIVRSILIAERHRRARQTGLAAFIDGLLAAKS